MKYFINIATLEDLRKEYRRLVKVNHPDNGGSLEAIKIINVEYERIFILLKNSDSNTTNNKDKYDMNIDQAIRDIINQIINFNINIEIIGSWIWVSGNTYSVKNELKECGFIWASKKKMWAWHSPEDSTRSKGNTTIDDIRIKYGSQTVKQEVKEKYIAC